MSTIEERAAAIFKQTLENLGFDDHKPSQMTNSDYWLCTTEAMVRFVKSENKIAVREALKELRKEIDSLTTFMISGEVVRENVICEIEQIKTKYK